MFSSTLCHSGDKAVVAVPISTVFIILIVTIMLTVTSSYAAATATTSVFDAANSQHSSAKNGARQLDASHYCDEGTLGTICKISILKTFSSPIQGSGTLVIEPQGALLCTTLSCRIKIEMDTAIHIHGHVNASEVDLKTQFLHISQGGIVGADGGGHNSEQGRGAGKGRIGYGGSGGGYGGYGSTNCDDSYIEPSGPTYGDVTDPTDTGSGGGMGSGAQGGSGGGYIKIKGTYIMV